MAAQDRAPAFISGRCQTHHHPACRRMDTRPGICFGAILAREPAMLQARSARQSKHAWRTVDRRDVMNAIRLVAKESVRDWFGMREQRNGLAQGTRLAAAFDDGRRWCHWKMAAGAPGSLARRIAGRGGPEGALLARWQRRLLAPRARRLRRATALGHPRTMNGGFRAVRRCYGDVITARGVSPQRCVPLHCQQRCEKRA
jgi:hypothetical protein